MTLEEYKKSLYQNIKVSAQANIADITSEFMNYVTDILIDADEIDGFEECYFEGRGKNNKRIQIDGYNFDNVDKSCNIIICDFTNNLEKNTLINADVDSLFNRMQYFVEYSVSGYIGENFEISSPGVELSYKIKENLDKISKFRFFILTDKVMSKNIKSVKKDSIFEKPVDVNVWDLNRLFELELSGIGKEEITINLEDFNCTGLKAVVGMESRIEKYSSYLTTINGKVLADIYLQYGAKLLEGNVRSFLSVRSKVNKGIRNTIVNHPEMFFAYNNGIAATASDITYEKTEYGINIKELKNLQIINGGQTTASIANALINKEGMIEKISVPMKLSILDSERSEEMIPKIALYANSQNKIDEADFASNHPFHVAMEKFSRTILAPAIDGNQYQKGWFYERARGQYNQAQIKLTPSRKKAFTLKWDKKQIIKKVELAKYMNSYNCMPHIVSRGAQYNAKVFNDSIKKEWNNSQSQFNEWYFKKVVALAILFKRTEKIVSDQDWYKAIKSYRANIVTYTLSVLFFEISKIQGFELDFKSIWNKQRIYPELEKQLVKLTKQVYEYITSDSRPILNVTQWCKQELCWKQAQKQNWDIDKSFLLTLVPIEESIEENESAKKQQKENSNIKILQDIMQKGSGYWRRMLEWSRKRRVMTPIEEDFIRLAANIESTGKLPTERQGKKIMTIKKRMESEGFE